MSPTLPTHSCSTEFFGFSHRPFRGTPGAEDYVAIDAIDQEVQRLAAAAAQGDGVAVLTAAPGAGKTLVCQQLQTELSARFEAVMLSSAGFATRRALLQAILFSLGQEYENCSEQELRLSILNYARSLADAREGIILIVDEAHLLNVRLLEELRCLTNHSQSGQPLFRVVLCGQLPLEDALVNPALEALNYRITCHATLEPLSMQESARLIDGRLQTAGRAVEEIFTAEALETICRVSDGNPRCLVQLCDESLRLAADDGQVPVEVETVRMALHQLKQLPLQWNESAVDRPHSSQSPPLVPEDSASDLEIGFDADTVNVFEPATSLDDPPEAEEEPSAVLSDDDVPGWSNAVCSVELGADDDRHVPSEPTGRWSSFEPESGWEPMAARRPGETADVDEEDHTRVSCGEGACSVPLQGAAEVTWSDRMAEMCIDNVQTAAEPLTVGTTSADVNRHRGFIELPVEDAYAVLDARKGATSVQSDAGTFDQMLRSSVAVAPRRPRRSVREPIADADPSTQFDAAIDPQTDPVQRLDNVITALSAATTDSAVEPSRADREWQSTGDCRDYDVLEPGGLPQWDEPVEESPSRTSAPVTDVSSRAVADRPERVDTKQTESVRPPLCRPYARLFSRARQRQS